MPAVRQTDDGVVLDIRVTPSASSDRIEGIRTRDDGRPRLHMRVCAVPDKGRANKAVVALLAGYLGVPKSAISVATGAKGRDKTLSLRLGPDEAGHIIARLDQTAE